MKKIILAFLLIVAFGFGAYVAIIYNFTYSEGFRAGELVKITNKGVVFKTWEGEISQGVAEAQRFHFSVEPKELEVISDLKEMQGQLVKLHYKERYGTFPWLGDTKYFITKVEKTSRLDIIR